MKLLWKYFTVNSKFIPPICNNSTHLIKKIYFQFIIQFDRIYQIIRIFVDNIQYTKFKLAPSQSTKIKSKYSHFILSSQTYRTAIHRNHVFFHVKYSAPRYLNEVACSHQRKAANRNRLRSHYKPCPKPLILRSQKDQSPLNIIHLDQIVQSLPVPQTNQHGKYLILPISLNNYSHFTIHNIENIFT